MFWHPADGGEMRLDLEAIGRCRRCRSRRSCTARRFPSAAAFRSNPPRSDSCDAAWKFSEHATSVSTSGSIASRAAGEERFTGMLLPAHRTESGARRAAAALRELRAALGVDVTFETGVSYLRRSEGEIPDGDFFARVASEADCGILLDLHDVVTNERNGGDRAYEVIAALPRERVWEFHLAGGYAYGGFWIDAHSGAIDPYALELAEATVGEFPNLRAIVFEIAPEFVANLAPEAAAEQIATLRSLWRRRARRRTVSSCAPLRRSEDPSGVELDDWERALASIALGRAPEGRVCRARGRSGGRLAQRPRRRRAGGDVVRARSADDAFARCCARCGGLSLAVVFVLARSLARAVRRTRGASFPRLRRARGGRSSRTSTASWPSSAPRSPPRAASHRNCGSIAIPRNCLAALAARKAPRALRAGDYVVRLADAQWRSSIAPVPCAPAGLRGAAPSFESRERWRRQPPRKAPHDLS